MHATEQYISSPEEMEAFGKTLAKTLTPGSIAYLRGDLGTGKTTLARGVIRALGYTGSISSPTYTIINSYDTSPPLHHLDLYRLHNEEDYFQSGLGDTNVNASIWLIEWPDKAIDALPKPTINIQLRIEKEKHHIKVTPAYADRY